MIYNESEHLDAKRRHNEQWSALMTRIAVDDPEIIETKRQRAIIEKALAALGQGDTQRTRELLREL